MSDRAKRLFTTAAPDGSQNYVRRTEAEKGYSSAITRAGQDAMNSGFRSRRSTLEKHRIMMGIINAERATKR